MKYMGIDNHNQSSHITLMDEAGGVLKRGKVANYRIEMEVSIGLFQGKRIWSGSTNILACCLNHWPCYGRDISPAASGTHCLLPSDVSLL